jgi:hypothetical protein
MNNFLGATQSSFLAIAADANNAGYHLKQTTVKQENLLSA